MCYFLYGSLYGDVPQEEYDKIAHKHRYHIRRGTKHDVKNAVKEVSDDFRITDDCCDCDSPVGKGSADEKQIQELTGLVKELSSLPGAQAIYFCKTWAGDQNKREETRALEKIDAAQFFADVEEKCLYTIKLD